MQHCSAHPRTVHVGEVSNGVRYYETVPGIICCWILWFCQQAVCHLKRQSSIACLVLSQSLSSMIQMWVFGCSELCLPSPPTIRFQDGLLSFCILFSFSPGKNVFSSTLFHRGLKMSARLQEDVGCIPWLTASTYVESMESYPGQLKILFHFVITIFTL